MGRRVSRLTVRKKKRTYSEATEDANEDYSNDEDDDYYTNEEGQQLIPPDEARWRKMNPYGLFAIDDKDGTKHRFRRGQIATILPQGKSPGDPIEPHEYWVGKILEIRADAGSEDSNTIWAKVQWFYSPQDAIGVLKSLASTPLGKFERLLSDHWDFVLPQTFNEVVPLPRLHTFPRLPKSKTRKKTKREKVGKSGLVLVGSSIANGNGNQASVVGGSDSVSTATTSTITPGAATATGTGTGGGEVDQEVVGLETQIPIGPETFYWRYTLEVHERKINPKPTSKICLCSKPYNPDSTSILDETSGGGVMLFCPRPTCRTGFHVGCLRDTGSVFNGTLHDAKNNKKTKTKTTRSRPKTKNKGKSKLNPLEEPDAADEAESELELELEYISTRALRLLSTSPDTDDPIDLLGLVTQSASSLSSCAALSSSHRKESGGGGVVSLLQRIYHRQRNQLSAVCGGSNSRGAGGGGNEGASAKTKFSGGSIIEVEDLLIKSDDDDCDGGGGNEDNWKEESVSAYHHTRAQIRQQQSPKKPYMNGTPSPKKADLSKTRIRKGSLSQPRLTPNALLATLFLLPSPFSSTASHQHPNTISTSTPIPSAPTPTTSNHIPLQPQLNGTSSNNNNNNKTANSNRRLLLELASQPLLRGAAYFPSLGPTGNINAVLAARKLVWEVLRGLGGLELSSPSIRQDKDDGDGEEKEEQEGEGNNDEEAYHKIIQHIDKTLSGWKERFQADTKIVPPPPCEQVVEDFIVVDGLILVGQLCGEEGDTVLAEGKNEGKGEGEENVPLGQKRRRVGRRRLVKLKEVEVDGENEDEDEEEDLLLRVDWVCPGCGGSI